MLPFRFDAEWRLNVMTDLPLAPMGEVDPDLLTVMRLACRSRYSKVHFGTIQVRCDA